MQTFFNELSEWCEGALAGFAIWAWIVLLTAGVSGCAGLTPSQSDEVCDVMAAWGVLEMDPWEIRSVGGDTGIEAVCDRVDIDACTLMKSRITYIREELPEDRRFAVLLHELGHLLRGGENVHLSCDRPDQLGNDVMCPAGAWPGVMPTDRDRKFAHVPSF